jgi:hypothetical protein
MTRNGHRCCTSLCTICAHLGEGADWWGVPVGGEFYDWMCSQCIEKFRLGDCPGLDEIRSVCAGCVRQMQRNSRLHYPVEAGDGSWRYEEQPTVDPASGGVQD